MAGLLSLGASPPEETTEARLRKLEARLEADEARLREQDEQIARLRREIEQAKAAPAPAKESWTSAFRVSGFIQADGVLYRGASQDEVSGSGDPLNEARFLIPRARLRVDVEKEIVLGALELDANTIKGPTARILDAELSARWQGPDKKGPPLLMGTIGLFKIPFGFEVPQSETSRLFLERSNLMRALFPGNYDLGIRLQGGYRFIRYALALMNGDPIGERTFPGRDSNAAKDFLGRIGVDVAIAEPVRIQVGVSALSGQGFHKGTPSTKDVLVWRDANEDGLVGITEIQVIPGAAATPSESFHRFALGADLRLLARIPRLGELCVYGEIARAGNLDRGLEPADPVGLGRDLRELGFHVGLTQEITQYAMIGARYDRYNPDTDASEQRGASRVPRDSTYATLAVAAALRVSPGRLILEFDHNDNALGRSVDGAPTTLADDALTIRGEVTF